MTDLVRYKFKIDAFTPGTLPMKRLAEYMLELAQLMGEHEHTHFVEVEAGSAVLVNDVDYTAVPKVRDRLRTSSLATAPEELVRRRSTIDKMLADDNATGVLHEVGNKSLVLQFRGRDLVSQEIPGVVEDGAIQGQLVRIGGTDDSAHATIKNDEGSLRCDMPRDLARLLAPYLYGATVRIEGKGNWCRAQDGDWELQTFKATTFKVLSEESLREGVARLRKANAGGRLLETGLTADQMLRLRVGR